MRFFDFDGTIFHNERVHQLAMKTVMEEYGNAPVDPDELRAYVGLPYRDRLEHMLAMRGIADDAVLTTLEQQAQRFLETHLDLEHMLVPGIRPLITALKKSGVALAVVSSSPRERIETDLDAVGILSFFDHITAVEDVVCRKPHPEPYEKTLAFFGALAKDVIAFEDAPPGIESAMLAGISVIALSTTFEEPDLVHAKKVIPDYTHLTKNAIERIL